VSKDGKTNLILNEKGEVMRQFEPPDIELREYRKIDWILDPAPWVAAKLDPEILQAIYLENVKYLAELSELAAQGMQRRVEALNKIAKILG
jgi:hypothetical protein